MLQSYTQRNDFTMLQEHTNNHLFQHKRYQVLESKKFSGLLIMSCEKKSFY